MSRAVNPPSRYCQIIPPFLLEAIARNGNPQQQAAARRTLEIDRELRRRRETAPIASIAPVEPIALERKYREVYSEATGTRTLIRSEGQPASADQGVDEAYEWLGRTFDLYWKVYERNSIDGNGSSLIATVHSGQQWNNAMWTGTQMLFGDGDGIVFNRFTLCLDVTGHEMTHGIVQSQLQYSLQAGALNESVCDVFGSLVKQYLHNHNADEADWLIGAGMFVPGINGIALRSMSAPGTAYHDPLFIHPLRPDGRDPQPDHMSGYVNLPPTYQGDWGGVHINSGIPNKAFYLVATALGGHAWDRAGRIWYDAIRDDRLSYASDFQQFASITANIALARYGADVRTTVVKAWHAVGIEGDALHVERSRVFNAPKAAGSPSAISFAALGVTNIIYRDAQGRVHELWQKGADSGTSNLTYLADNAIRAAGDPTSYIDTPQGVEVALYRATDGHVHSLYWSTGDVGHDALSGAAHAPPTAGKPVGSIQKDGTNIVIYRTSDGHLHSLWWTGANSPGTEDLSPPNVSHAAGDPCPYTNTNTGENIVAYRGSDGHIHTLYWTTGAVGHDDLSGVAGSPAAAGNATGDPVAYYTPHNDGHQVTYRSANGHVQELWWMGNDPVQHWDLTAAAGGAEPAASAPAAYYNPGNNTKHVFYRIADGHLHELWWVAGGGNPVPVDVTNSAYAPLAKGNPAAFIVEGSNSQHVVYRGADDHIHEIRWV
jgi:hypothetical protein